MQLIQAHQRRFLARVRELFREYAGTIDAHPCFEGLERELNQLPGGYAPPTGGLWLAVNGTSAVGCVALRKLGPRVAELKRLYVRAPFRGQGLGRQLAERAIAGARRRGYVKLRLNTMPGMKAARALYRTLGFCESPARGSGTGPGPLDMVLDLRKKSLGSRTRGTTMPPMRQIAAPKLASSRTPVPPRWRKDVERLLITDRLLAQRVRELAREIERDFAGREMVVVSLLNGTVMFLGDLIRHLCLPLRLDFMGVSSYGAGTESGKLVYTKELRLDVRGRDVLLVDDILDTGRTVADVRKKLLALNPRSVKVCVLLDKPSRRVEKVEADYVGFTIPDVFVVGYGLDYAEKYRNLPFVGVLRPELYESHQPRRNVKAGR